VVWNFTIDDLKQSRSRTTREYVEEPALPDSNLDKLHYDSYRCDETNQLGKGALNVFYNDDHRFSVPGGSIPRFQAFLAQQIPNDVHRERLLHTWSQPIISLVNVIEEVTQPQCLALMERDAQLLAHDLLYENDQGLFYQPKGDIKANIHVVDNQLYIDVTCSNIAICRGSSNGEGDNEWRPYMELPGEISVRWKVEEDRRFIESGSAGSDLLRRLLMEESVEVTPLVVDAARREYERDNNLDYPALDEEEVVLANRIYALKLLCDKIGRINEADHKVAVKLHNHLVRQQKALFICARTNPKRCRKIITEMNRRINEAHPVLKKYRSWKRVAIHIGLALTVIGGLVMVSKGVISAARGKGFDPFLFKVEATAIRELKAEVASVERDVIASEEQLAASSPAGRTDVPRGKAFTIN